MRPCPFLMEDTMNTLRITEALYSLTEAFRLSDPHFAGGIESFRDVVLHDNQEDTIDPSTLWPIRARLEHRSGPDFRRGILFAFDAVSIIGYYDRDSETV